MEDLKKWRGAEKECRSFLEGKGKGERKVGVAKTIRNTTISQWGGVGDE